MQPFRTPLLRRLIPWVLGGTLVVLAVLAITRIVLLREQLWTQVQRQAEERLEDQVQAWEEPFLDRLDTWMQLVADLADAPGSVQAQIREQSGWVESVYVWRPARQTTREGPTAATRATMIFPTARPATDRLYVSQHACIKAAQQGQFQADRDPRLVAEAYRAGCADAPAAVQVEASIEAAAVLDRAGFPSEALAAIDEIGPDADLSLAAGMALGVAPDRLSVRRNRRAELLMTLGRESESLQLYYETGQQLAELDAPDAANLETYRWAVLDELKTHGRPLLRQRLELSFQGLDRRIRAWREITTQILPAAVPLASSEPRLIRDQYAQLPYLLYYGVVEAGSGERLGVALQLDQQRVLNDFLASTRTYSDDLVITDASGAWVLGARRQGRDLAAQVGFSRTLEHLRVGLYPDSLEARAADLSDQWIIPLVVTTFLLVIGFFALSSQIAAQRRLRELLERQREFTTRVTHELKTPVAGIKVMAENLELGAFKGDDGRRTMARRIVEEADRLTSRIDEVLATTQERRAPIAETFDIEESVYELIDVWVPRMEQRGVAIEADIDEAPEVRGDPEAVRDAIGCLLDNALKYRDPDRPDPKVWLSLGRDGRDAIITVTDNGLGVPKGQREQIFRKFSRVEGPHRGLAGGHGLGLAQVEETAREHGGSVVCLDGVDGGARFVLRLRGLKS